MIKFKALTENCEILIPHEKPIYPIRQGETIFIRLNKVYSSLSPTKVIQLYNHIDEVDEIGSFRLFEITFNNGEIKYFTYK